jgi:hypothetical protein
VSQQVTVDGNSINFTQVLNDNCNNCTWTNITSGNGTVYVYGSSFTSIISINGTALSGTDVQDRDLYLAHIYNSIGGGVLQVYNSSFSSSNLTGNTTLQFQMIR